MYDRILGRVIAMRTVDDLVSNAFGPRPNATFGDREGRVVGTDDPMLPRSLA